MPRFSLLQQYWDDKDEIENVPEPEHPIGFGPQNYCRWMDSTSSYSAGQSTYGLELRSEADDNTSQWQQVYPPLSSYISSNTVTSRALLSYHKSTSSVYDTQDETESFCERFKGTHEPTNITAASTLTFILQFCLGWSGFLPLYSLFLFTPLFL